MFVGGNLELVYDDPMLLGAVPELVCVYSEPVGIHPKHHPNFQKTSETSPNTREDALAHAVWRPAGSASGRCRGRTAESSGTAASRT